MNVEVPQIQLAIPQGAEAAAAAAVLLAAAALSSSHELFATDASTSAAANISRPELSAAAAAARSEGWRWQKFSGYKWLGAGLPMEGGRCRLILTAILQ